MVVFYLFAKVSCAWLRQDHPLAKKTALSPDDLCGQAVTLPLYDLFRGIDDLHDHLLEIDPACDIKEEIYNNTTIMRSIMQKRVLVTFGPSRSADEPCVSLPLAWQPPARHGVIYRTGETERVRLFVELARKLSETM